MGAKLIKFLNTPVSPSLEKHQYNFNIERYRGLCAILVFLNHLEVHPDSVTNNYTWPIPIQYLGSGYISVLMFFCISGYALAVSNNNNRLNILLYLKKRSIRLYPVYLVVLLFCILLQKGNITLPNLLGNLFFLGNTNPYWHFNIPIYFNGPTWSINYEVLYYILFIAIFFIKPKMWQLLGVMTLLSVLTFNASNGALFIALYINGYYFWILGLLIGWKMFGSESNTAFIPLLSMLFLHLCQSYLGIDVIILRLFGLFSNTNINWLFNIPFCLMIMAMLTGTDSLFLRVNKLICYLLPGLLFLYLIVNNRLFEDDRWIMCFIFWMLALLLYNEIKISSILLKKLTWVGKISYGLYLVHMPVAFLIKNTVFIHNQQLEVVIKYILWIILTFLFAAFLELRFQPFVKKYICKIE